MSNISNLAEAREARRLQQPHQSSGSKNGVAFCELN